MLVGGKLLLLPLWENEIENRKSKIENRKSKVENRKSKIESRKSKIENRMKILSQSVSQISFDFRLSIFDFWFSISFCQKAKFISKTKWETLMKVRRNITVIPPNDGECPYLKPYYLLTIENQIKPFWAKFLKNLHLYLCNCFMSENEIEN